MTENKSFFVWIWCIWLLPFASVQLLPFGIPLYPIEILLLVASPFLINKRITVLFHSTVVQKVAIFSLIFLGGTAISFWWNKETLAGLGQIKSFFFFPIMFWFLMAPLLRRYHDRKRVFWHLRMMFVWSSAFAMIYGLLNGLTYDHRLHAWFDSPNLLAIFLLPGVILCSAHVLSEKTTRFQDILSWILIMGVFIMTQSYGSFVAAFIAVGGFLWISREYVPLKNRIFHIVCISFLLIIGGIFLIGDQGSQKWNNLITGNERSSLSSRMMIWRSACRMIYESPIVGIGPGRFQEVYLEYQHFYPPYLEWAVPHPHNLFLSLWLSSGMLVVSACVWLSIFIAYSMTKIPHTKEKALLGALFLGVFVSGLWDVPYFRAEFCYLIWIEIALFCGMFLKHDERTGVN